ncbi:hypothetical protein ACO0LG_05395 [Undibacterium sp. Ji42W]|uniref:hypothetical protein n=1 Tax=Undibacterium sp. Ji42W TaxID=3413039 RepID=UPI003BF0F229
MTSRNDDMHVAEFEDFLQGKGELASLLQDLPQAQPSAELDAAIIAEAEGALAAPLATRTAPAIVPPAANDAIGPEGSGKPPSFFWRWKLPLSLAASILFAIPVVMQQNQESYPADPVTVRAPNAPAVPTAPAIQEKDTPALPQLAQADLTKQAKVAAEVAPPAAAPAANMNSAAAPAMEASKAKESQVADDARRTSAAKPHSEFRQAQQQAEPLSAQISASKSAPAPVPPASTAPAPMVAAAPEPARVTITGSAIRRQDMAAAPAQMVSAEEKVAADSQYAGNAKMRAPAAKTSDTESRSAEKPVMTASRSAATSDATGHVKAETAAADKKADMPAAVPFPAAQPAPRIVMAPPPVATAPPLSAALAPEIHPGAYEWLERIEQLLKNHRNKEALEEWRKFRASYPGYTVDQSLQKQIDVLQK